MNRPGTILFFGALPPKDESKVGGGEWGNLRTVNMLRGFGYNVHAIHKTNIWAVRIGFLNIITIPIRFLCDFVKVIWHLLFRERNSVFHYSGFAWKTIVLEYLIIRIVNLMECRLVYEIRGGGLLSSYNISGNGYRRMLKYILTHSDCIFSQGMENLPLIRSLCSTPIFHYANCVEENFYPAEMPQKPTDIINLLYFGRIHPDKNLSLIIDTAVLLKKQFNNLTLTIIGNGEDRAYVERINKEIREKMDHNSFSIVPGCSHSKIKELLTDKHFYLFPSTAFLEGQSNSVTEAMSFGIIPIASPQGFNRSTIGEDYLIVEELTAEAYAEKIKTIISEGLIDHFSYFVRSRFLECFSEKVIFERTKKEYERIFAANTSIK